jgi:hypothetical protein
MTGDSIQMGLASDGHVKVKPIGRILGLYTHFCRVARNHMGVRHGVGLRRSSRLAVKDAGS